MHPNLRRTPRAAALIGAVAVAVLGLSGCIKVDAEVGIGADARASGTFEFELEKDAAGFLGISDLASFESQIDEGALTEGDELDAFTECTTSESDTGYVYSCTFENTTFAEADGLWRIAKEGEEIVFTMASPGAGAEAAGAEELLGGASLGSINVDVEFPGPITSVEGDFVEQTSDNAATVTASMMDEIAVTIRSEAGSGPSLSVILVLVIAVAIIVLLVVAVILLVKRRRAGTTHVVIAPAAAAAASGITPAAVSEAASAEIPALEASDAGESTDEDQSGSTPPA